MHKSTLTSVLVSLLLVAPFTFMNQSYAATFTISPTSGGVDRDIAFMGDGFLASTDGIVWFDSNGNGLFDSPVEPKFPLTSDQNGAFHTGAMSAPNVPAGIYNVLLDLPQNGIVDGTASFTIIPMVRLHPLSGPSGTEIRVSLSGFTASSSGFVWFDQNSDGIRDNGEPSLAATTDNKGSTFSSVLTLTAPMTAAGNYKIKADVPAGGSVEASTIFKVTKIVLSPTTGSPGQVVNVQGSGFLASYPGKVWFDKDKDGIKDTGETSINVVTSSSGTFTAALTVPIVPRGLYPIRAEVTGTALTSADFIVKPKLTLTSSYLNQIKIKVVGTGYDAGKSGFVWFDTDGDSTKDTGEPAAAVTTTSSGTFTALLNVQAAQGTYKVRTLNLAAFLPTANFVATPHIYLKPNSGTAETVASIYGNGFQSSVIGFVWFDTDNDNVRDKGEPAVKATSNSLGFFKVGLTVPPGVAAGSYKIKADLPSGGIVEATQTFKLTL